MKPADMDATTRNASVTSAQVRTNEAYKNRWRTLMHNPKLLLIAFFASYDHQNPNHVASAY